MATGGGSAVDAAAPPPSTGAPPPPFISWPDVGEAPPATTLPAAEPALIPKPWTGTHIAPGLTGDPTGSFTGPAVTMGGPRVVYPLDGSMHPINIVQMTVQWTQGATTSKLFRLHFENQAGKFDVYAPCTAAQCIFQMPETAWQAIAEANPDRDVRLTISGTAGAGSPVLASAPITIRFTPARVKGALYYWSTKLKGTYRLTFGQKKAMPFMIPTGEHSCYGCHAVSRNGKTIAMLAADDTGQNILSAVTDDLTTAHRFQEVGSSAPMSLTADGSKVLVAWNQGLTLLDAQTGMRLAAVKKNDPRLLGQGASFPEWSPDGTQVALMVGNQMTPYELLPTGIGLLPFENGMFGTVKMIVPAGAESHFYPTWSPDGKWIAFASGPLDHNNYDNANAQLRLVGADGGTVYDMARATRAKGLTSTWPKFSPFAQLGNQLLFVTFSSKMPYGFVVDGKPQLWFAAIDLRRLAQGDPSWAPVWLPFQEADQTNHLGFWTEVITCQEDEKCGEFAVCKAGACVPVIIQ